MLRLVVACSVLRGPLAFRDSVPKSSPPRRVAPWRRPRAFMTATLDSVDAAFLEAEAFKEEEEERAPAATSRAREWFDGALAAAGGARESAAVAAARAAGADAFGRAALPLKKQEPWRFTKLEHLWGRLAGWVPDEASGEAVVVVVDGVVDEALSRACGYGAGDATWCGSIAAAPDEVLGDVAAAFAALPEFDLEETMPMRNRLGAGCWCALNAACAGDGVVVWAREDAAAAAAAARGDDGARVARRRRRGPARLHVVHVRSAGATGVLHPRTVVHVGDGARVALRESFVAVGPAAEKRSRLTNARTNCRVGAGGVLTHVLDSQEADQVHVHHVQCGVRRDGEFRSRAISDGAAVGRVADIRSVARRALKLTFKGRIAVPVTGQKTNADQICKSLLLDDGATVNAMPSLEIVADDVKCTHGATIADLDEGLFYLNSRMPEKDARKPPAAARHCTFHSNPMGGATAVLRAALAAAFAAAAPAPSRGALACLRSCADSLAYPPDARAHFDEIHRALDNYSHVSYARLAGYRGPWIENRWIAATRADLARADAAGGSLRDVAGPFVPLLVPWLDEWLAPRMWHYPPGMVEKLLGLLRPSVAYVTVSQTNCGVTGDFTRERLGAYQFDAAADAPNLLVLSSGGYGHVPVPLLKQPEALAARRPPRERRYFASFVGSLHTAPGRLRYAMNDTLHAFAAARGVEVFVGKAEDWRGVMADSRFSLCPRASAGRRTTSPRRSTSASCPSVYSDTPWLPYPERFADVGFNASIDGFADLLDALHALRRRGRAPEANAGGAASHFNFDAALGQIKRFIEMVSRRLAAVGTCLAAALCAAGDRPQGGGAALPLCYGAGAPGPRLGELDGAWRSSFRLGGDPAPPALTDPEERAADAAYGLKVHVGRRTQMLGALTRRDVVVVGAGVHAPVARSTKGITRWLAPILALDDAVDAVLSLAGVGAGFAKVGAPTFNGGIGRYGDCRTMPGVPDELARRSALATLGDS
ncbi:hypothetical protein JL721_7765 [Aureococcus anophagefferens]|nr:hypothetical protein JL721_7765 [Aureococcus anophagefferens]